MTNHLARSNCTLPSAPLVERRCEEIDDSHSFRSGEVARFSRLLSASEAQ